MEKIQQIANKGGDSIISFLIPSEQNKDNKRLYKYYLDYRNQP